MLLQLVLLLVGASEGAAAFACPASEAEQPWCDPRAPADARAANLLARLTLPEKIAQLQTSHPGNGTQQQGSVPRLHLQAYTTGECLHGVIATNVTVFPQSISLAATFDRDLVGRVAAAIGREVRGRRNAFERSSSSNKTVGYWDNPPALLCFSPQINIVRDPRWGRNQETYGESPFLTGTLANTYVRHLQGDHPRYLQAVATPKHFNAFGGRTSNGTYPTGSPTDVTLSLRDWVETFLTAFEHVLDSTEEAGNNNTAESTMCSYNNMCQVDDYEDTDEFENRVQTGPCPGPAFGVPACASKGLLKDTLRNTWEWNGYVFGDDGAIKYIQTDHHWADDQPHAARDALDAGVDMALGGGCSDKNVPEGCISYGALPEALHERLVTEQGIDAALHRVLRARFRLGLMDDPVKLKHAGMAANPYESIPPNVVDSPAHRALAREAAEKSVVLLKNGEESYASTTGSLPLPLPRAREFGTIAVIGPNANVTLSGNYAGSNPVMSTMLGGICAATSRPVDYARGCDIDSNDTSGFDAAVAAARNANVTIFFAGLSQMQEHEGGKRASIAMPGVQDELMSALRDVTDALIVVIVGGSAISAGWAAEHADAVLWVGYGGEEAGHGFASVLFGDVSPSGKMPFTMYNGDYQLPIFGRYDMRGKAYGGSKGRTFRFLETRPLWYFGYGLGYSRFEMSKLVVTPVRDVPVCSPMELHLQVEEIAGVRGAEIVQVYVSRFDPKENPQAVRVSLAGYQRVFLEAGQKNTNVTIRVSARSLAEVVVVSNSSNSNASAAGWMWTPGKVRVWVGGRSPTVEEISSEKNGRQRRRGQQQQPRTQKMLYAELVLKGAAPQRCSGFHLYDKVTQ